MDITLGNILAMMIPTVAVAVVGWLLNRSVGDVDRRVQAVETQQAKIEQRVVDIKDEFVREVHKVHTRISKVELEQGKTETRLDSHLEWHRRER